MYSRCLPFARDARMHARIPNYKDTNCLRYNNTFSRFFYAKITHTMTPSNKTSVRQRVRAAIATLDSAAKAEASTRIVEQLTALKPLCEAKVVALFSSLADEPQTTQLVERLCRAKIRVVMPRIEGAEMEFYDTLAGLESGAFGIMEPIATTPIAPSEIDVMIVPGVAFTREGSRCGRGKGFYDKYLSREGFRAYTIGICYSCQIVEELPTELHDKIMNTVIHG